MVLHSGTDSGMCHYILERITKDCIIFLNAYQNMVLYPGMDNGGWYYILERISEHGIIS